MTVFKSDAFQLSGGDAFFEGVGIFLEGDAEFIGYGYFNIPLGSVSIGKQQGGGGKLGLCLYGHRQADDEDEQVLFHGGGEGFIAAFKRRRAEQPHA